MSDDEKPAAIPVTRTSMITGITRTLELPITHEQLMRYERGGILLQDAFPDLRKEDREFIKTGITGAEWQQHVIGEVDPQEAPPHEDDNRLFLIAITPETLGLALDLLEGGDVPDAEPERADVPDVGHDPDIG